MNVLRIDCSYHLQSHAVLPSSSRQRNVTGLNLKSGAFNNPHQDFIGYYICTLPTTPRYLTLPTLGIFRSGIWLFGLPMALVDYSDSEDSDDNNHGRADPKTSANADTKFSRKRTGTADPTTGLPRLPEAFHDLYASASRISNSDDPSLHDGRQRAAPHVEGQWPTHVYIECESDILFSGIATWQDG